MYLALVNCHRPHCLPQRRDGHETDGNRYKSHQELITTECEAVLGNTYNLPQHDVTMTRPFCLSRFLTNARAGRAYHCIHAIYISIL